MCLKSTWRDDFSGYQVVQESSTANQCLLPAVLFSEAVERFFVIKFTTNMEAVFFASVSVVTITAGSVH